jgi:hypothetical protein
MFRESVNNKTNIILSVILLVLTIIILINFREMRYNNKINIYIKAVNDNLNDNISMYYSKLCANSTLGDVECVMEVTGLFYNYNINSGSIRTPVQYVKLGGDCEDVAVFYATIFKRLGYNIIFRFPLARHVSLTISQKISGGLYKYCDIEGDEADCHLIRIQE